LQYLDTFEYIIEETDDIFEERPDEIKVESVDTEEKFQEKETPQEITSKLFDELRKIKKEGIPLILNNSDIDQFLLHKVFDKSVSDLLNKDDNREILENIFIDFNYELLNISPLPLMVLAMKNNSVREKIVDYLANKNTTTSNDVLLIIMALKQYDFRQSDLLQKLENDEHLNEIFTLYKSNKTGYIRPGYFNLSFKSTYNLLNDNPAVVKQMELRVINEKRNDYSVSLNHLVNELQSICYLLDINTKQGSSYNAQSVADFIKLHINDHLLLIKIRNMFDRRNNNLISHSGDKEIQGTAVSEAEYFEYNYAVKLCLLQLERSDLFKSKLNKVT
jgi:hypothetical protein